MKSMAPMIVLTLAVSPVRAQFADLNAVALKDVRTVSVPEMKQPPAPAGMDSEKGISQGTRWFHYGTAGTSEQDGSSVQMDFTADEASNMNYHHYSFGKVLVRFYTSTAIEAPAKVQLSFKPGDQGMNYNVPKTIKKTMTHAKDETGFYYYADISEEASGARLEANGQIFTQELSFTKQDAGGVTVKYQMLPMKLFYSMSGR